MKRLLLILILLIPVFGYSQATLMLKSDTLDVWVGQYQHPKNTLRARWGDADSTLSIIGTDNTVFAAARRYNAYVDFGATPFTSYAALKSWILTNFFVNASGSSTVGGFVGGHAFMTGNGTTSVFNIITNAGFIPSYFTLTTTTPITQNQLNRSITFPDSNTMRITFENAPLDGEDTDYVWIVYK